jgi:predicted RNA binding protein YcfA (HicA-like mRNA interferase family)
MAKISPLSGKKMCSILCKRFGFISISQKGSHIKLRKEIDGERITVIVPNHNELADGTFHHILKQARIEPKDFSAGK